MNVIVINSGVIDDEIKARKSMNRQKIDSIREWLNDRRARIEERKMLLSTIEEAEGRVYLSLFGRFFGSTYLRVKWLVVLIVGICLVLGGIFCWIDEGSSVTDIPQFAKLKEEKREKRLKDQDWIVNSAVRDSVITGESQGRLIPYAEEKLYKLAEEDYKSEIQKYGALSFFFGLFFLYISRLTKKMRVRNLKITEAQYEFSELIELVRDEFKRDADELEELETLLSTEENSTAP